MRGWVVKREGGWVSGWMSGWAKKQSVKRDNIIFKKG